MEIKKNGVNVYIHATKRVSDAVVIASFEYNCSAYVLSKLAAADCNIAPNKFMEHTVAAYSFYQVVHALMCGNPVLQSKFRVTNMAVAYTAAGFSIIAHMQPAYTYVRKYIVNLTKMMDAAKLFSSYDRIMRATGRKPSREIFNYVANQLNAAFKTSTFAVVGKLNLPEGVKDDLAGRIHIAATDAGKLSPESKVLSADEDPICESGCLVKCTGVNAALFISYLHAVAKCQISMVSKGVFVHDSKWASNSAKYADAGKIEEFAERRFAKKGFENADIAAMFAYVTAASGHGSAGDVHNIVKNIEGSKVKDIAKKIGSCF